jgi:hypothetical protein
MSFFRFATRPRKKIAIQFDNNFILVIAMATGYVNRTTLINGFVMKSVYGEKVNFRTI